MSYNSRYGGSSSNGASSGGRDRDRDRERSYYPRYGDDQDRFSSSSYQEQQNLGGYRRQETRDNREYYGYRGSGYGRGGGSGANNGGNAPLNSSRRRRNGDKYDSYQGSKYRPSSSGRGRNSSSPGLLHPMSNSASWSSNGEFPEQGSYYSGKPPYDDRYDQRGEDNGHEFTDERRNQGRKSEWDSVHKRSNHSRSHRDQYKPDANRIPAKPRSLTSPEKLEMPSLTKVKSPQQAEDSHVVKTEVNTTNVTADSSKPKEILRKPLIITDEKLLHLFDDSESSNSSEVKAEKDKDEKKVEKEESGKDAKAEETGGEPGNQTDSHSHSIDQPASKLIEKSTHRDDHPLDEKDQNEKDRIDNDAGDSSTPDSPIPSMDTSVLSPVGSPVSDMRVIKELNVIAEHDSLPEANDNDNSDAETVIADGQAPLNAARRLLRKEKPDESRTKLKRKVIFDSDEEEEDEVEDTHAPERRTPTITRSPSPAVHSPSHNAKGKENESASEDDLDDSEDNSFAGNDGNESSKSHRKDYKIKRDSTGRSLLQRACKKGDLAEVKSLIERGADANESDFGGFTCLHEAALAGHTDIVEYLIEQGANVNKQALEFGDFETPLMDAAENKHIDTVKILLKNGADPDICNADGYSALTKLYHLQHEDDYKEIIDLLDAASEVGGKSSLDAVSQSPRKILEDPAETYFADLVKKKSSATIFKYLAQGLKELAAGDFVTNAYSLQKTPDILNVAARSGHVELVDILLGLNPGSFDINQKNRIGVTVLLATVGRGHYDVVKFLLTKGADPKVKRDKDGLNALQVAKHSAQHDPREVILLEQYLTGNVAKDSETPKPGVSPPKEDEMEVDYEPSQPAPKEKKRRASEDEARSFKKAKSKDPEDRKEEPESKSLESKFKADDEGEPHQSESKSKEREELKREKKQASPVVKSEELLEETPSEDAMENKKKTKDSASASPAPLTKAQEEQRIKAAEEAKIWQEKVQAKKRARKEMFLLAEKEKEKKRKEDEVKKIEELKQQKEKEIEEKLKEAQKAQQLAQEIEKKRAAMEAHKIMQRYPIGLQEASFEGSISDKERLKFSPLYVFTHDGEDWVIDLQIALLLAAPVSEIHKHCQQSGNHEISVATKDALWPLFFHMVGVGKHDRVDRDGREKFATLRLCFLKLSEVTLYVRELYPEVESLIWKNGKLTYVTLDDAKHERSTSTTPATEPAKLAAKLGPREFVPPKWKQRRDVLRTICSANTPLW